MYNEDDLTQKCKVCGVVCKPMCSNCNQIYYCTVEHQKQDWKNHRSYCHPFKVARNDKLGRFLIATRNIKAGEIVLKESCLVCGPSQITGPVCVGCMTGLEETNSLECEKCGWPVCQMECQFSPEHKAECDLISRYGHKMKIQQYGAPHPQYQCLSVLRCMLLRDTELAKFERLMQLESLENQRRGTNQWKSDREGIAKFIPRFFKVENWSEEEIMRVTGILQTNGHEVPLSEPPYVAIYDNASLVEHSCFPNLTKSFSKNGDIVLWAGKEIKRGANLSICYSDALWGTKNRQNHLLETKLFKCECVRCKDVTELGTMYSAVKCNKSVCPGFALPRSLETWNHDWRCTTCQNVLNKSYINDIHDQAGTDVFAMKKNSVDHCIRYLQHYAKWFPPQHFYLSEVKVIAAQLIGTGGPKALQEIDDESLNSKILYCQETLGLYHKLAPAEARILGLLHFEIHAAYAELGRRLSTSNTELCKIHLKESLKNVEQAVWLLQHEPKNLSEGQVFLQAKTNRDTLKSALGVDLV